MLSSSLMTHQTIQLCTTHKQVCQWAHRPQNWIGTPRALLWVKPKPFQDQPHLGPIQECVCISAEGAHLPLTAHLQHRLENEGRKQSRWQWYFAVSACPPALLKHMHTPSFVSLSFGCDWQTPELWKGRKSFGEAQRYFYHSLCLSFPPSYISEQECFYTRKKNL